ncbi:phospho-N-acetylmuramoyl-pentapeptide-transferase, partial [Microcoleus sp. HI-ES]|nr:phospho-N-acetylmuramoyl-pentapeptide-transferase [Microcoleus sp. HI-ES]
MDNFLDEKIPFSLPFKLTGRNLFLLLGLGLGTVAIGLDVAADRFLNLPASLFMPLVVCALVASGLGYAVVPVLQQLKAGQIIREDGPQAHLKKAGTPTMGGIFFIPAGVAVALLWCKFKS